MLVSLMPGLTLTAKAAGDVYPEYVITHGASGSSGDPYYVYKKENDSSAFVAFGGDDEHGYSHSTITDAMLYVTKAVGTGHATLIFGETGTTDESATGTLDIGSEIVVLGASGAYTIKGDLTGSSYHVIELSGASVEVEVSSGTVSASDGMAIYSDHGSGDIIVSGGTVTCSAEESGYAISNFSTGSVTVSSGRVESTNNAINNKGGDITVSGGKVYSAQSYAIYSDTADYTFLETNGTRMPKPVR